MTKWIPGAVVLATMLGAGAGALADSKPRKVDQITCEEFLTLNPTAQQRIAYWVDGYAQAKGEVEIGSVAFDKFGHPVGTLVDDCKAAPKETLWQKLKNRF